MSYIGNKITIPFGDGGLDKSDNRARPFINRLIEAKNASIYQGYAGKEGGSSKQNSTAISSGAAIISGKDYYPTLSTKRGIIATSDGKLMKDDNTFAWATTLKSGLTSDKVTSISEGGAEASGSNKKLFFCNGADTVQVLSGDGATTSNISNPSTDWATDAPVKMLVHLNRNFAIAKHFFYFTPSSNHEDFTGTGSGSGQIYPGEGDELINAVSIYGRLYFFKRPSGLYYLDQSLDITDPTKWGIVKVSDKIGCAGSLSMAQTPNDVFFMSPDGGLHVLSGAEKFGDVKDSDLTSILNIENIFKKDSNLNRLDRVQMFYYGAKKQVWVCYSSASSSRHDMILKLDVSDGSNIKASITDKDSCESIWSYKNTTSGSTKPLLGGSDGFIRTTDEENENVDGASYQCILQTPYTSFGYADPSLDNKEKILDRLEITAEPAGEHAISVDVFIDGNYTQTVIFNMGKEGAALDSFILDTDRLDGTGISDDVHRAIGSGKRFSFAIRNSGLNEGFNIDKLVAYVRAGTD